MIRLVFLIATCACTVHSVPVATKLKALIASTRGFRRQTVPSWQTILAENLVMFHDLGFPKSSQSLLSMDAHALCDSHDLTEAIRAFGVFAGAVIGPESLTFAGHEKSMTLKSIDTTVAQWRDFASVPLDDDEKRKVAEVIKAAEKLREIVANTTAKKQRQNRPWCVEYQRVSTELVDMIDSLTAEIRLLIGDALAAHVETVLVDAGRLKAFKAVVAQLVRLEVQMLELDATLLSAFRRGLVMHRDFAEPLKWFIYMMRCVMTGFLVSQKQFSAIWSRYQSAHAKSRKLSRALLFGEKSRQVKKTCWLVWRRALISRLMIISEMLSSFAVLI